MKANRQLRRQAADLRQRLAQHRQGLGSAGKVLGRAARERLRNPVMLPRAFVAGFMVDQFRPLLGRLAVSAAATGPSLRRLGKLATAARRLLG